MKNFKIKKTTILEDEIISLNEAKTYLRVTGEIDDNLIKSLLKSSICFVEGYLRQDIQKREIIALFKNNTSDVLSINAKPLNEVIYIKEVSSSERLLERETDYDIESDNIFLKCREIPKEIEIKYISGLEVIPDAVKHGILLYLNLLYDREVITNELLESIFFILNQYKNIRL